LNGIAIFSGIPHISAYRNGNFAVYRAFAAYYPLPISFSTFLSRLLSLNGVITVCEDGEKAVSPSQCPPEEYPGNERIKREILSVMS
jgi:hypothetical protein